MLFLEFVRFASSSLRALRFWRTAVTSRRVKLGYCFRSMHRTLLLPAEIYSNFPLVVSRI